MLTSLTCSLSHSLPSLIPSLYSLNPFLIHTIHSLLELISFNDHLLPSIVHSPSLPLNVFADSTTSSCTLSNHFLNSLTHSFHTLAHSLHSLIPFSHLFPAVNFVFLSLIHLTHSFTHSFLLLHELTLFIHSIVPLLSLITHCLHCFHKSVTQPLLSLTFSPTYSFTHFTKLPLSFTKSLLPSRTNFLCALSYSFTHSLQSFAWLTSFTLWILSFNFSLGLLTHSLHILNPSLIQSFHSLL